VIACRAPGSDTCTDLACGGSPGSSGNPYLDTLVSQTLVSNLNSNSCTKDDKAPGGIKCSKSNTLEGLKGDKTAAAQFCPNKNWQIAKWWPLNFVATTKVTGPQSKQNQSPVSTESKLHCWLTDKNGTFPFQQGYQLSPVLAENKLVCQPI
jgi:hypothetical protein